MQTCLVPRPRAEMGAHHQSHGRPWAEMSAHHQSQGHPRSMGAQGRPWNHTNPRIGSQPTNETINHSSYGTDPQQKNPHHYRFLFNNINGIHFSSTSILELMSIARGLQLDWLVLAETHLDTHKQHVQLVVRRAMSAKQHNGFKSTNCVFSQSDLAYEGNIKFGGVLQLATDNLASRTTSSQSASKRDCGDFYIPLYD